MDKTYKFKFYNRYIITLRDSKHIGRRALKEKAKAIVDSKIRVNDDKEALLQLADAIGELRWNDLDNPEQLIKQIKPIFEEELKDNSQSDALVKLQKYIQSVVPKAQITISDIYDDAAMDAARKALAAKNTASDNFNTIIDESLVRSAYADITEEIQAISARYLRKPFTGSCLNEADINEFINELKALNEEVAIDISDELSAKLPELKKQLAKDNQSLTSIVRKNTAHKDFTVDILDKDNVEIASFLVDRVKEFDFKLNTALNPYQPTIVKQTLNQAHKKLKTVFFRYVSAKNRYAAAVSKTEVAGLKYATLLKLSNDYTEGLTEAQAIKAISENIEQLPISLKDIRKQLSTTITSNGKAEPNDDLLTKYLNEWLKSAKNNFGITTPDDHIYMPNETEIISIIAKAAVEENELLKARQDFDDKFIEENKDISGVYDISRQHLNVVLYFWEEAQDEFYNARRAYIDAHKEYEEAYREYQEFIFPASKNYGMCIPEKPPVPEPLLDLQSFKDKLDALIKAQKTASAKQIERAKTKEVDDKKALIIKAAYKFILSTKDDIASIASGHYDIESNLPRISTFNEFINWFKGQQDADPNAVDNEYLNDVILPRLEALAPADNDPALLKMALLKVPKVLNTLLSAYNKGDLFVSKSTLSTTLNAKLSENSQLTYLDDLYNYLKEPIRPDEMVDEDNDRLTLQDIMQHRVNKWFTDTFKTSGEFLVANPYMDTLISSILFKTRVDSKMNYSVEHFKNLINTYLYEYDDTTDMRRERHNSAYMTLKAAWISQKSSIKDKILDPFVKNMANIKDDATRKKEFLSRLPGVVKEIANKLSNDAAYIRVSRNGTKLADPTPVQQGWIDGMMDILENAAKEEKDAGSLISILKAMFETSDRDMPNFYNDVRTNVHARLQNESSKDPGRNISNALEHFLFNTKSGMDYAEELKNKVDNNNITPGELAEDFIKTLREHGVLQTTTTTDPIVLTACKTFENTVISILSGAQTSYNKDVAKRRSVISSLWSYIDNYILAANGLRAISSMRNWQSKVPGIPPKVEESEVKNNIKKAQKEYKSLSHGAVKFNEIEAMLAQNQAESKGQTNDSAPDKHCLACSGVLKYYKDSELYECPMCHIVYSKSMLK